MSTITSSLSSIPSEQFQPLVALFYCTFFLLQFWSAAPRVWLCKALYMGSVKRWHWCSSEEDPYVFGFSKCKYYVLHLSKEPFPKNVSDLEVVKTARISLLYADFNVWKKVGNYCCVQDDTVLLLLPTFFQTLKSGHMREKQSVLTTSRSLTVLGNDSLERWRT